MSGAAIIHNPRSGTSTIRRDDLDAIAKAGPVTNVAAPESFSALVAALDQAATRGADVVVVSGGDGTVREVMTALSVCADDWAPAIALVANGKTNLVAREVGSLSGGVAGIKRAVVAAADGSLFKNRVVRQPLDVKRDGKTDRAIRGFFFGAGIYTHGTQLGHARLHANGVRQGLAVGVTIAAMFVKSMLGHADDIPSTGPMKVKVGDGPTRDREHFIVLASTLERAMLGLGLFWGTGEGPVRYTEIDAPPDRLHRAIIPVLRGKPRPWMEQAGYRSGRTHKLELELHSPFVVDGEVFTSGPSGRITITPAAPQLFVTP